MRTFVRNTNIIAKHEPMARSNMNPFSMAVRLDPHLAIERLDPVSLLGTVYQLRRRTHGDPACPSWQLGRRAAPDFTTHRLGVELNIVSSSSQHSTHRTGERGAISDVVNCVRMSRMASVVKVDATPSIGDTAAAFGSELRKMLGHDSGHWMYRSTANAPLEPLLLCEGGDLHPWTLFGQTNGLLSNQKQVHYGSVDGNAAASPRCGSAYIAPTLWIRFRLRSATQRRFCCRSMRGPSSDFPAAA